MTAEQIVRALAAADTLPHDDKCALCFAWLPTKPVEHDPDCPWRLAVEWVDANPEACERCGAALEHIEITLLGDPEPRYLRQCSRAGRCDAPAVEVVGERPAPARP